MAVMPHGASGHERHHISVSAVVFHKGKWPVVVEMKSLRGAIIVAGLQHQSKAL